MSRSSQTPAPAQSRATRTRWSKEMVHELLSTLATIKERGRQHRSHTAYHIAAAAVTAVSSSAKPLTAEQVNKKMRLLNIEWLDWRSLTYFHGWTINAESGLPESRPAKMEYIFRTQPRTRKFQRRPLEHQDLCLRVFGDLGGATGRYAVSLDELLHGDGISESSELPDADVETTDSGWTEPEVGDTIFTDPSNTTTGSVNELKRKRLDEVQRAEPAALAPKPSPVVTANQLFNRDFAFLDARHKAQVSSILTHYNVAERFISDPLRSRVRDVSRWTGLSRQEVTSLLPTTQYLQMMNNMAQSKVVILTGASRGIGLAVAHFLLKRKHNLVVIARSKGPLDELRQQYGDQVLVLTGDLSDFSLGAKARDLAINTWQRLDGLILNHGVLDPVNKVADGSAEEWRKCFDINFFSYVATVQACLPALRESKGRIVLCSSGASTKSYSTWGAYGATKAAVNHLAATLATEEPDVTTVSVRPGVVDTEMQRAIRETHAETMDEKEREYFADLKVSGKLLKPEQPGHVMAQLATDAPRELSGQFLSWNDAKLEMFQNK